MNDFLALKKKRKFIQVFAHAGFMRFGKHLGKKYNLIQIAMTKDLRRIAICLIILTSNKAVKP